MDSLGKIIHMHTNRDIHRQHTLDYITENVIIPTQPMPIINSLCNRPLDWTLIHRRFSHIYDRFLHQMSKHGTLQDLPKSFPISDQSSKCKCAICWKRKIVHHVHGSTLYMSQ